MRKVVIFALVFALFGSVRASWYWPFGSEPVDEKPRRVSELIEPASVLIEEASDLAAEGKTDEAVEKYRMVLAELNRIELEYPDRAKTAEFATLRNKRAYVNAAIDSLLLNQVKSNAKVVAVSDTTELEKRLDRERWGKRMDKAGECLDRRDPSSALVQFEKAMEGTTNAVMIAATYTALAGAHCQKGSFEDACRALVRSRKELLHAGELTDEEKNMVSEFVKTLRTGAVVGYGKAMASGRRACEDLAGLAKTEDLTTSNAVAQAGDAVASLASVQRHVGVFAFPTARRLTQASSNLQMRVSALRGRMESGKNPKWNVDVSVFESALKDFGSVASEIRSVNAVLLSISPIVGVEVKKKVAAEGEGLVGKPVAKAPERAKPSRPPESSKALTKREKVIAATANGDWATAERLIGEMLVEKPNGATALNLKAAMEARQGKFKEAEATLDQTILSNPRSHFAYYNMANLMLQVRADDKSVAKRYYETGRVLGGPVDAHLEEVLK